MMRSGAVLVALSRYSLLAASLWACGGSQPAASTAVGEAPTGESAPADAAPAVPGAWSDALSDKEKAEFMKAKVMPAMSKLFLEHDAKAYENFSCKTCHGPQFKDPDEFLPPLVIKDGKRTADLSEPAMVKFMSEKVLPEMALLFGKPAYDAATKQGFGCAGCHEMKVE